MTEWYGATRLMPDKILSERLDQAQKDVQELMAERDTRKNYPPEIKLAFKLHGALCVSRDCDWGYQDWKCPIMTNIACPGKFLTMAKRLRDWVGDHNTSGNSDELWTDGLIDVFKQR
jgi:hypothetical protein